MKIRDRVFHQRLNFEAKDFDEQEGFRFTFEVEEHKYVETGAYLHWKNGKPLDIAIDLSCMSGCSRNCSCAVSELAGPKGG